jgi:hypothetical protein
MLSKDDILKKLSAENYFIDLKSLEVFISDWKINAVFEDENGIEYFDDISVKKIRKGITLKAQGYPDETIATKLEERPQIQPVAPEAVQQTIFPIEQTALVDPTATSNKMGNLTLDVSSQTLQMIAEAVAKKISDDIQNSDFAKDLIEAGGYKRDNEILSKQIAELLEDNKKMAQRIEALETKKSFWQRLFS